MPKYQQISADFIKHEITFRLSELVEPPADLLAIELEFPNDPYVEGCSKLCDPRDVVLPIAYTEGRYDREKMHGAVSEAVLAAVSEIEGRLADLLAYVSAERERLALIAAAENSEHDPLEDILTNLDEGEIEIPPPASEEEEEPLPHA